MIIEATAAEPFAGGNSCPPPFPASVNQILPRRRAASASSGELPGGAPASGRGRGPSECDSADLVPEPLARTVLSEPRSPRTASWRPHSQL
jgi:hypothetical protein